MVFCTCNVTYTGLTGATVAISGLPFTSAALRQATVSAFFGGADSTSVLTAGTVVEGSDTLFYAYPPAVYAGVGLTAYFSCWYAV